MTQFTPAQLSAQLDAVRSEIAARRREYPRLVRERRFTQEQSDKGIAIMEAVAVTVEKAKCCAEISEEILKSNPTLERK